MHASRSPEKRGKKGRGGRFSISRGDGCFLRIMSFLPVYLFLSRLPPTFCLVVERVFAWLFLWGFGSGGVLSVVWIGRGVCFFDRNVYRGMTR